MGVHLEIPPSQETIERRLEEQRSPKRINKWEAAFHAFLEPMGVLGILLTATITVFSLKLKKSFSALAGEAFGSGYFPTAVTVAWVAGIFRGWRKFHRAERLNDYIASLEQKNDGLRQQIDSVRMTVDRSADDRQPFTSRLPQPGESHGSQVREQQELASLLGIKQ